MWYHVMYCFVIYFTGVTFHCCLPVHKNLSSPTSAHCWQGYSRLSVTVVDHHHNHGVNLPERWPDWQRNRLIPAAVSVQRTLCSLDLLPNQPGQFLLLFQSKFPLILLEWPHFLACNYAAGWEEGTPGLEEDFPINTEHHHSWFVLIQRA